MPPLLCEFDNFLRVAHDSSMPMKFFAAASLMTVMLVAAVSANAQNIPWPDPVANHVVPYQSFAITHGPVLGGVRSDGARVWIRCSEATEFEVLADTAIPFGDDARVVNGTVDPAEDFTGTVGLDGLAANTVYFYAIRIGGEIVDTRASVDDPWPGFRTLPDVVSFAHEFNPAGKFSLSFSIGSCQRQRSPENTYGIYDNPPAFDRLWKDHRDDLAFHIVNGDYSYEEVLDGTLAGIENNYKLYLERGRSLNRLLRHVPMFTMFNDHEVTDNLDGAGEPGLGDGIFLVRDPAVNVWQYYAGWTNDNAPHKAPLRFGNGSAEAGDVLHDPGADFSTLDLAAVSTLHVGPYLNLGPKEKAPRGGANIGVYRVEEIIDATHLRVSPAFKKAGAPLQYSIGSHHYWDRLIGNMHFIFLDTRSERAEWKGVAHSHDEDRYILGETQREWFLKTAQQSPADFLFVISGDPWVIYHSAYHMKGGSTESKGDGYCGYVHEREILLEALDQIEKPVLLLTGDVHQPFACQISDNVWEFLCSPVNSANHPLGTTGLPPLGGWFDSEGRMVKIKWCGGYPDNLHYPRQRHTTYTVIDVNNIVRAAAREGQGYQYIAYDEPQVVVRFHDGYTGKLLYAEGISTLDAKPLDQAKPFPKKNRFGHWSAEAEKCCEVAVARRWYPALGPVGDRDEPSLRARAEYPRYSCSHRDVGRRGIGLIDAQRFQFGEHLLSLAPVVSAELLLFGGVPLGVEWRKVAGQVVEVGCGEIEAEGAGDDFHPNRQAILVAAKHCGNLASDEIDHGFFGKSPIDISLAIERSLVLEKFYHRQRGKRRLKHREHLPVNTEPNALRHLELVIGEERRYSFFNGLHLSRQPIDARGDEPHRKRWRTQGFPLRHRLSNFGGSRHFPPGTRSVPLDGRWKSHRLPVCDRGRFERRPGGRFGFRSSRTR